MPTLDQAALVTYLSDRLTQAVAFAHVCEATVAINATLRSIREAAESDRFVVEDDGLAARFAEDDASAFLLGRTYLIDPRSEPSVLAEFIGAEVQPRLYRFRDPGGTHYLVTADRVDAIGSASKCGRDMSDDTPPTPARIPNAPGSWDYNGQRVEVVGTRVLYFDHVRTIDQVVDLWGGPWVSAVDLTERSNIAEQDEAWLRDSIGYRLSDEMDDA